MSETNGRTMSGSTADAGRPVQAWWVRPDPQKEPLKRLRAVAYYRHSAEIAKTVCRMVDLVLDGLQEIGYHAHRLTRRMGVPG